MNKFIFLVAILLTSSTTFAQTKLKALALATADTTNFSVNSRAGWQLYNSYIAPINTDSITVEMIVQHDRVAIDWKQEQLVGRIKQGSMCLKRSQTVSFMLMFDEYLLRVEPNGRCYLWLAKGPIPDGDPVIIPVRAKYKLCWGFQPLS